jgi:hypothetical protein
MTAEFLSDLGGAQSPPAQRDDAGAEYPVAGGMAASGEFVDLALLFGIFWRASVKHFRHVLFSFPVRRFGCEIMYTVFEERSTNGSLLGWDMRASSLESGLLDPSEYAHIRP